MAVDLPYNQSLLYLCMDGGDDDANANALGRNVGKDLLEVLTDYLQFEMSTLYSIEVIPCFWTAFSVPSRLMVLVVFMVYALISIVAVVSNGILIFLLIRLDRLLFLRYNVSQRQPSLRTPSNLLVLSLSMSDMLMVVKVPVFMVNLYQGGPFLGVLGAKVPLVLSILYRYIGATSMNSQ